MREVKQPLQDIDCCAAEGWPELGRERLDKTERKVLNLCPRKTNTTPCISWTWWDYKRHYADILERDIVGWTVN